MSDYISREMAKAFFTPQKGVTFLTPITVTVESLLATIDNIPAADVRPARMGNWVDDWETGCSECSACHDTFLWEDYKGVAEWNFCPNCGADMRPEEEE